MTQNNKVKWQFDADFLQACSCDYGCPCEFSAPPTRGFCEGMGAWRIQRGRYGEVVLDGLSFGFAARWPKAIHEGNGTLLLLVDERANAQQRQALLQIATGQAGGLPFEILAQTISKLLEPRYVPICFELKGRQSAVRLGEVAQISTEPIKNPVTKEPEEIKVSHATGFIFKEAECVSAKDCKVSADGLSFSWPDKAGFVAQVQYHN